LIEQGLPATNMLVGVDATQETALLAASGVLLEIEQVPIIPVLSDADGHSDVQSVHSLSCCFEHFFDSYCPSEHVLQAVQNFCPAAFVHVALS
jgi:hypothetical protein